MDSTAKIVISFFYMGLLLIIYIFIILVTQSPSMTSKADNNFSMIKHEIPLIKEGSVYYSIADVLIDKWKLWEYPTNIVGYEITANGKTIETSFDFRQVLSISPFKVINEENLNDIKYKPYDYTTSFDQPPVGKYDPKDNHDIYFMCHIKILRSTKSDRNDYDEKTVLINSDAYCYIINSIIDFKKLYSFDHSGSR